MDRGPSPVGTIPHPGNNEWCRCLATTVERQRTRVGSRIRGGDGPDVMGVPSVCKRMVRMVGRFGDQRRTDGGIPLVAKPGST